MNDFLNFHFISRDGFIRIYPKGWALVVEANHNFKKDIVYQVATPERNPEKKPRWTPVYYDAIWKKWMTSLIIPVYCNNQFKGLTGGGLFLDNIFQLVTDMSKQENCAGFIFESVGNIGCRLTTVQ